MRLAWPFRRDVTRDHAHALYVALAGQARQPAFYGPGRVADSVEGRFELMLLHAALVVRRLNGAGLPGQTLAQVLFDVLFDDLDRSLREMGIADLAVAKRVKRLASAFYGRARAYEAALEAGPDVMAAALERNLFAGMAADPATIAGFAGYAIAAERALNEQADAALLDGHVGFPAPPG